MKKILIILALICATFTYAETVVERNGDTFVQTKTVTTSKDTQTKFTYEIKDTKYPIFITKNGRCYIMRTSKNGNDYKMYLSEDIARQICKELGVEYKEKQ